MRLGKSIRPCSGVPHGYNASGVSARGSTEGGIHSITDPEGFGRRLSDMDAVVADS
jgi:hypothetical protein